LKGGVLCLVRRKTLTHRERAVPPKKKSITGVEQQLRLALYAILVSIELHAEAWVRMIGMRSLVAVGAGFGTACENEIWRKSEGL
jgi:hypothetical protein